jgi:hypothetical protein
MSASAGFSVPKRPVEAAASFFDGHREEIVMFVSDSAPDLRGILHELLEMLNAREAFLPAKRRQGGNVMLLRKSRIRWIELADAPESFRLPGEEHRVGIGFPKGDNLRGSIFNDMPQDRRRVQDFFNAGEGFFAFKGDFKIYLVNRAATARVYDPPLY